MARDQKYCLSQLPFDMAISSGDRYKFTIFSAQMHLLIHMLKLKCLEPYLCFVFVQLNMVFVQSYLKLFENWY